MTTLTTAGYTLINRTVKVENYNNSDVSVKCDAVAPECGVCYGEVTTGECFVKPAQLTENERKYMEVSLF